MDPLRNVNPERFSIYRLCDCSACVGTGKEEWRSAGGDAGRPLLSFEKCSHCRGEGRVREEVATCATPEAVGVALVTLAREGEFEEGPIGLLDRTPECETCEGVGHLFAWENRRADRQVQCHECKGSGVKPTGTWLILPWTPSARNVTDAARTLARSKKKSTPS